MPCLRPFRNPHRLLCFCLGKQATPSYIPLVLSLQRTMLLSLLYIHYLVGECRLWESELLTYVELQLGRNFFFFGNNGKSKSVHKRLGCHLRQSWPNIKPPTSINFFFFLKVNKKVKIKGKFFFWKGDPILWAIF